MKHKNGADESPLLQDASDESATAEGDSDGEVINNNNNNNAYQLNNNRNNNIAKEHASAHSTKRSTEKRISPATKVAIGGQSGGWPSPPRLTLCSWSVFKRKLLLGLVALSLVALYLNSYLLRGPRDERVPVLHYSHVPGMKVFDKIHVKEAEATRVHSTSAKSDARTSASGAMKTAAVLSSTNVGSTAATSASSLDASSVEHSGSSTNTFPNFTSTPSAGTIPGYLVWSERCKMPNIDPYMPDVMEYFQRQKYEPCSTQEPLTRVQFVKETQRYALIILKERIQSYSHTGSVDCCYQAIRRNHTGKNADSNVSLSKCIDFGNGTQLPPTVDNIIVRCKSLGKQVYINGYPLMPERDEIRQRLNNWRTEAEGRRSNATSVLMIGIDSISRINLIRAMPKTAQYLYDNEWFEMSGYNKIDDNTFPNLMAVLTGRNKTNAFKKCPPTKLHGLDDCPFIWKTFREHGYVTAYAEDEASINTFNYLKLGFVRPPVDYYLRPFLLSAEKVLPLKRKSSLIRCVGYQNSADYIYNYALELATRYAQDPYFGLFWTNTFSHNAISDCSAMDSRMVDYLRQFAALGTLKNAIVIFLSDHGLRFGPTRRTLSGHLEERLPFMFLWLPPHLKHSHPEFVNALSVNKNRLTNPYDLHMTLKHVLAMSGRVTEPKLLAPAEDCPRCQTLLSPVLHNRSCEDIAIEEHWCTCIPFQSVYKNSKTVLRMGRGIVQYINEFVSHFRNGSIAPLCHTLRLHSIDSAYRARPSGTVDAAPEEPLQIYRINFNTKPNQAVFEATVRYNALSSQFEVTGEISRLDAYARDSQCVSDGAAKKYCSCRKKFW